MAVVKKYLATVSQIKNPIPGIYTVSFEFEKGGFKFKPGQFLHLTLDEYDPSAAWPESRCFSMQTSPQEEIIKITYAVKGRYTARMEKELKAGSKIWIKLPFGDLFTLDHSLKNCVFIAGGTGITPFLSLFTDDTFNSYKNPSLYFGAKSKDYNLYSGALSQAGKINPGFKVNTIYEDSEGILDIEKIFNENRTLSTYFISGPPLMIKSFRIFLIAQKVDESRIKTDEWE